MSSLIDQAPFAPRDEEALLRELNELTRRHLAGCEAYRRIFPTWSPAFAARDVPALHVGAFKHVTFRSDDPKTKFVRVLKSSSTSGSNPSRIHLDEASTSLQTRSSSAILASFLPEGRRPLLILEDASVLRHRAEISARTAAAMSLWPTASAVHFVLRGGNGAPEAVDWPRIGEILRSTPDVTVYATTAVLWTAWANAERPPEIRESLRRAKIQFVHSGGWKKLSALQVEESAFERAALEGLATGSQVTDFYGLTEQPGIVFPRCAYGARHVPRWAAVLVRDPFSLDVLEDRPGILHLLNVLAVGAPYHSVLTDDLGETLPGACPCGRGGPRFRLLGRLRHSEPRGCANVG